MFIIILFILIAVTHFFSLTGIRYKKIVFLFCGIVLIFTAAFRNENYSDYGNYVDYFNQKNTLLVEPSFILISKIIHLFTSNVIYLFIVFAILGVTLKIIAIKELTSLWLLSLAIYVSNFFILHELIQIRAGVASGCLLLCIKPIHERNWKKFLFFSILGITFHYSALLILPLYFLGNKPRRLLLFLSIPFGYIFYFTNINPLNFLPIPGIQDKINIYKQLQEEGGEQWNSINVFNLLFLTRIAIFYFILWKYELIVIYNEFTPVLLKIYCISLVFFLLFAQMPVMAFRINELLGIVEIVLIPLLFYTLRPRIVSKGIVLFIGLNLLLILIFYSKIIPF